MDKNPFEAVVGPAPVDTQPENPFDRAVIEGPERRSRQQFLEVMRNSQGIDPARQAKAIEVARERGMPPSVAYQYLDELTPQQRIDYDSMVHKAPATAKLLSDPVKGPVASPDAQPLGDVEENLKAFVQKRGLDKPAVPAPLIDQVFGPGASNLTPEQQAAEQARRVKEAKDAAAALPAEQAAIEAERQRVAEEFRKSGGQDLRTPFGGNPIVAGPEAARQGDWEETRKANDAIVSAEVNPPTQKASAAYLNTVLRTLGNFPTMTAQGASALLDSLASMAPDGVFQLDKNGRTPLTQELATFPDYWERVFPTDKGRANDLSMKVAEGIASGLPFIAGGAAFKAAGLAPGWFAALAGGLQQAGQGEMDAVRYGASTVTKNLTTWLNFGLGMTEALPIEFLFATASAGRRGLSQFLSTTASNAAVEAIQNSVLQQTPADLWARYAYDPKRDVWGNSAEAFLVGGLVGGLFGATAGLASTAAQENYDKVLALGEAAKKLKIADIAPQILDQHIAELAKAGQAPVQVTAPAEAVETLFQEMGPELAGQFPKTAQSLAEARATGVEVTIPTEELVRLGKLKGYQNFAADVRIGDEMTLNEVQKLRSDVEDYVTKAETTATPQEESPVYQDIRNQLLKAGQSPEVATAQARMFDAFFTSMSERTGKPAADLARRYGVEVRNSALQPKDGETVLSQGGKQTDTPEFKAWFGDSKVVDEKGAPLVVYHGTRSDFDAFARVDGGNAYGDGFYFTKDPSKASDYATGENVNRMSLPGNAGPNVMPVFLSAKKPFHARAVLTKAEVDTIEKAANNKEPGYFKKGELWKVFDRAYQSVGDNVLAQLPTREGVTVNDILRAAGYDSLDTPYGWVVFDPTQIKSATGNRGTFDPNNPNILYQSVQAAEITIDPKTPVPVVVLEGAPPESVDWKAEGEWVKKHLQKKTFTGSDGKPVHVSRQSLKLTSSNTGDTRKALVLHSLPKVIEKAVVYNEGVPDTKGRDNLRFAYAASVVRIEGVDYAVALEYRVDGEGKRVAYQLLGYDIAPPGGNRLGEPVPAQSQSAPGSASPGSVRLETSAPTSSQPIPEEAYTVREVVDAFKSGSPPLFQSGPDDVRGSIQFGPLRDKFIITLTQKANLSTFIHEGGHFFLEVLQDLVARGEASAQQVADLKTLKRWMGVEDAKQIDRGGHEKFARSWEQFLMEGKAPSLALHGIFQKFKAWMIFVYKRLANVRGELNDEIRSVMDRLVASDAAIAEARALVGWRGQPMSQEETGLSDAEYKAYVGEWTKANDAQSLDADARIMLEAARELKKTWTEEKARVTREVENELAQSRGWKAWKLLETGEGLQDIRPGWSDIKIDPESIPREWRRDTKGMTAPTHAGGLPLDMVAEILGFDSGEQMLQAIGGAKLAQKAIPMRVRQIMVERHGEMDAAALSQEAMKAVHNTPTMDVLLTEFRALAAKANLKVGKDTKRMVRIAAEERVAQLTQRQLDPSKWRRAEVKAAEEAGKFAAKGQDTEAALAKRRQLMAAAMAKASLEAQDRIEKIKDYLATFTTNRRRAALGRAGETYLDAVDQILEGIQFKDVSLNAIKSRKALADIIKEADAAGEPVFVSDKTRDLLNRKNYSELTLEELEGVHDAVKNLWTIAKDVTQVRKGQEKVALEQALADITAEADATLPEKKQRDHLNPGRIDKMMNGISRYHAGNLKAEFILDWLGTTAHKLIYQPITEAAFQSWKTHKELTAPFMEKLRSMPREQKRRWATKRQFMDLPMPVTGANVWMAALNLGNASNKEKLLAGYGWSEAQLMAELNRTLTKEDWDLAQETWDTIDKMWPEIERIVKKATGLAPPRVEATPIDTPFGTYRGGYFPVVYDTVLDERMNNVLDSSITPEEMFAKRFTAFVINNGFTKGRTANTGKLLLSPDVIADHLGEVIHYVTHYEAVKQADKIIRSPDFKRLVKTRLGDSVYRELKQWLVDVATNTTDTDRKTRAGDSALRWLRQSAQLTSLGFNLLSILKQPMGVANALDAVGPVHWMHGVQKAWLSPSVVQNWKFAFEHSKELGPLLKSYDRDIAAINKSFSQSLGGRAKDGAYLAAFMPLSIMQTVANVAAWHGAYLEGTKKGMSEADAYGYADKVVRTTQGSGALKDLAGIQRGGEANKLFTMFYSYFSVVYNRLADIQIRERGAKNLHRKAMRYTLLLLIPSLLNMMADDAWKDMFRGDDRDKEKDTTPFLVRLGLETVSGTVAAFPVAREFYSLAEGILADKRARSVPAIGVFDQLYRAGAAVKGMVADDKELTRGKARAIVAATGMITGTPIYGIYRLIDDLFGQKIFDE